jgi:DNA-binding transcriptional MerR regulator
MEKNWTLADLVEASGVPARTIRFYIARGILKGPVKAGRDAAYTVEHLERLERIKKLQVEGRTLAEISAELAGVLTQAPQPLPWWQHRLADDVIVWVRADASPWRLKQVRAALDELARRLPQPDNKKDQEPGGEK